MYCAIRTEVLCHHGGSIAPSQPGTGPSRHSYRSIRVEVQRHLGLGTAPSGSWYTKIKYLFINSIIFFSISFILHIVKYNYIYIYIQGVSPNSQHRVFLPYHVFWGILHDLYSKLMLPEMQFFAWILFWPLGSKPEKELDLSGHLQPLEVNYCFCSRRWKWLKNIYSLIMQ